MQHDLLDPGATAGATEDPAGQVLGALEEQAHDLRALVLGLGGAVLLLWVGSSLFEDLGSLYFGFAVSSSVGSPFGWEYGPPLWQSLVTGGALLLVVAATLSSARSREVGELREEWRDLSTGTGTTLAIRRLERMSVWKEALRRNVESSVTAAILLPVLVLLVATSAVFALTDSLRSIEGALALGLTVGAATFAGLQVLASLRAARRGEAAIREQRAEIVTRFSAREGSPVDPERERDGAARPPEPATTEFTVGEATLLRREREAGRIAATERWIGGVLLTLAVAIDLTLAASTTWWVERAAPVGFLSAITLGYGSLLVALVLIAVGSLAIAWAAAPLLGGMDRWGSDGSRADGVAGAGADLGRIDRTSEVLDAAGVMATRTQWAFVFVAVVSILLLMLTPLAEFLPFQGLPSTLVWIGLGLALPVALGAMLWATYRAERLEGRQRELRRWVRSLARLEQDFWDRY